MTTVLLIILVLAGTYLTWRIIRTIPWLATLRLLALAGVLVIAILALAHFNIDLYTVLDTVLPDFGDTT